MKITGIGIVKKEDAMSILTREGREAVKAGEITTEELLDSGCVCVGNDEYDAPIIAGFEIVDKDEENLINTVVKVIELY